MSGVSGRVDRTVLITAAVAAVCFWVAYDDASYDLPGRATLAIAVWWAVLIGIALQLVGPVRVPRETLLVGGLLAGLALWTLLSVLWAPSAEDAVTEFDRVSLYLGVYLLVALGASWRTVGRWADGLALAIAGIAVVALVSRLFPGTFDEGFGTLLPSAVTRLSFPLGYWNGLAIFVALGVPLLLRAAAVARDASTRSVAIAPLPVFACVIYLASSRGGVVTAFIGAVAFIVLTPRRWEAVGALCAGAAASACAVAALVVRDELVNGPLDTDAARDQGRSAAVLILLACIGAVLVHAVASRYLRGHPQPSRRTSHGAVGAAVVVGLVAVAAADPVSRFDEFRTPPPELETIAPGDFATSHLLSGSGSGRWQFWTAAADQWTDNPVLGEGAGTYEHWWAENASFTYFLRDAHSLYLETLGELGPLGLALVLGIVAGGALVGMKRTLRSEGEPRTTAAASTAVFLAYAVAGSFDWVWELTAASVVGVAVLGLVTGRATFVREPLRSVTMGEGVSWTAGRRFGIGVLAVVAAWLLIVAQAIPLLKDREIARSQAAMDAGDFEDAGRAAREARDIAPWASSPRLQLALVAERRGDFPDARAWIEQAIERDPRNWRLWLVAARIETKLGEVPAAERSLRRAIALNPRSPLFAGLLDE